MAYPIVTVKMPSGLAGQPNGKLPASLLVKPGFPGRPLGQMYSLAAHAWLALARDVQAHFGEVLTVTSTGDAYRTYAHQEQTFKTRYTTTRLPGRPSKVWNGVTYWQKPGTAMAAVPGTSNHGWGLAADTCIYRDNAILGITANMPMFNWILLNAFRYGLSWEAQSEPWHLRYWSGDNVPPAVDTVPIPPSIPVPPNDEDDMKALVIKAAGRDTYYAWNGVGIAPITDLRWVEDGVKAGIYINSTPLEYPAALVDDLLLAQGER